MDQYWDLDLVQELLSQDRDWDCNFLVFRHVLLCSSLSVFVAGYHPVILHTLHQSGPTHLLSLSYPVNLRSSSLLLLVLVTNIQNWVANPRTAGTVDSMKDYGLIYWAPLSLS